jgi:hypothetical protein
MGQVMIAEYIGELVMIDVLYEAEDDVYRFTEDNAASLVSTSDGVVYIDRISLEEDDRWYCISAKHKVYPFSLDNFKTH